MIQRRRGRVEIIMDILDRVSRSVNKTKIVYGANLNSDMAERYLLLLIDRGLIAKLYEARGIVYEITEKGQEVLKDYKKIMQSV